MDIIGLTWLESGQVGEAAIFQSHPLPVEGDAASLKAPPELKASAPIAQQGPATFGQPQHTAPLPQRARATNVLLPSRFRRLATKLDTLVAQAESRTSEIIMPA